MNPGVVTSAKVTDARTGDVSSTVTSLPAAVLAGGGAATVQERVAGVCSTLPAASVPRTRRVYVPSARSVSSYGESQPANGSPLSEHSNVTSGSLAEK